jgi:hypothetical protein
MRRDCAQRASHCRWATVGYLALNWYCVPEPPSYCAAGPRAEAGPLALFCFSKFSDLVQIIATSKICTGFI